MDLHTCKIMMYVNYFSNARVFSGVLSQNLILSKYTASVQSTYKRKVNLVI